MRQRVPQSHRASVAPMWLSRKLRILCTEAYKFDKFDKICHSTWVGIHMHTPSSLLPLPHVPAWPTTRLEPVTTSVMPVRISPGVFYGYNAQLQTPSVLFSTDLGRLRNGEEVRSGRGGVANEEEGRREESV